MPQPPEYLFADELQVEESCCAPAWTLFFAGGPSNLEETMLFGVKANIRTKTVTATQCTTADEQVDGVPAAAHLATAEETTVV